MRIIGGIHRSRRILAPEGNDTTRPITDRVKQSLFDRLTAAAAFDGACLDLFSGTGSLGLEALSRGMDHCTFVERDRSARQRLEQNIDDLQLAEQSAVLSMAIFAAAWSIALPVKPVNLIFCDPPYRMTQDEKSMSRIAAVIGSLAAVAEDEALLVLRTDDHAVPLATEGWGEPQSHNYGSQTLHFYARAAH